MGLSSKTGQHGISSSDDADISTAVHRGGVGRSRYASVSSHFPLPLRSGATADVDRRTLIALLAAPLIGLLDRYAVDAAAVAVTTEFIDGDGRPSTGARLLRAAIDTDLTWSSLMNTLTRRDDQSADAPRPRAALTVSLAHEASPAQGNGLLESLDSAFPSFHLLAELQDNHALSLTLTYLQDGESPWDYPERLLAHYQALLKGALQTPGQRIAFASLLSDAERRQLLDEWSATAAPVPAVGGIHELIQQQAREHPGDTALSFKGQQISYEELNRRANQAARLLRGLGLQKGGRVGIYMDRHPDAIVAILGVLKAGGAYIPLDSGYPRERLAQVLEDSNAAFIVTHRRHRPNIPPSGARLINLDDPGSSPSREDTADLDIVTEPDDIAFVLFTSGSTAQPKGVMVSHGNLINYQAAWQRHCNLADSITAVCQVAHFSFAVFQGDWVRALCYGKKLVLCPREVLSSPRLLYELMQSERVDFAEFVPSLLRALFLYCRESGKSMDLLRILVVGADRWYMREHKLLNEHCPATRVIHVYGSSETTLDSTFFEGTLEDVPDHQLAPIGKPITGVRVYVVDRNLQPVPAGVIGELLVGGAGVAKGYLARAELTREKFIPDCFAPGSGRRLFRTGDMVSFLPDGNLAFHGRRDHQVKIRGFRIDLGEVEQVLDRYPSIREAIAHAVVTPQGDHQLAVYFVTHHGQTIELDWLKMHCRRHLPDYMVPAHFIQLEALPLTASGKIDRRALPNPWDGVHREAAPESGLEAGTVQRVVTEICCHALGRPHIEPDEDFALLGCDSMAIVSMIMGIENAFGFALDESAINPQVFSSVASVARFVEVQLSEH